MKVFFITTDFIFSFIVNAIEIGDKLPPCENYLQTRYPGGLEGKTCIENFKDKDFLLVEFMSIYCGSCIRTMPIINKIGKAYASQVSTSFVTLDRSMEDLEEFWIEYHSEIDHPLIFDTERTTRRPYKIKYTPTTILVNKSRLVVYKHVGEFDENCTTELEAYFK
jgi:thiol-disulfide isomerase/thioredoxin